MPHVRYFGPSRLDFPTLGLSLVPGDDGPGEPVEVPAEHLEAVRAQAAAQGGTLRLLTGQEVARTEQAAATVTDESDVEPPKTTVTLVADFDGTVTPVGSQTTYTLIAGEAFEAAPEDVEEILALPLGDGLSILAVNEVLEETSDLSGLKKAELQELAASLGLSDDGTVAELRERIQSYRDSLPHDDDATGPADSTSDDEQTASA